MTTQGYTAKPAFEAHNVVGLYRSPDRDRRCQRTRRGRPRAIAEAAEGAMHHRNQAPDLIDTDAIFRDITTDDLRNQARIDLLPTAVIGHNLCLNLVD